MLIFFLIATADSQLSILTHAGIHYQVIGTDIGYIPYGQNISGPLTVLENLCKPQTTKTIILTQFTKDCTQEEQYRNTQTSLLTIFSLQPGPEPIPAVKTEGTIILIAEEIARQLRSSKNKTINLSFQIHQIQLPEMSYVIYSLNQSTEVLKQVQQFINNEMKFHFTPVYYTEEKKLEEKCGIDLTTNENGKVNWEYGCRVQGTFETTYAQVSFEDDKVPYREMLYENLAQICIFQEYGLEKWLSYRISYIDNCYAQFDTLREIQYCQMILKERQEINQQKIQNCVNNSFTNNSITNVILSNHSRQSQLLQFPISKIGWVVINQQVIWGDYSMRRYINGKQQSLIFSALCASYLEDSQPICITTRELKSYQSQSIYIILMIIGVILITCICLWQIMKGMCKNKQKEINQIMILPQGQANDGLELGQVN